MNILTVRPRRRSFPSRILTSSQTICRLSNHISSRIAHLGLGRLSTLHQMCHRNIFRIRLSLRHIVTQIEILHMPVMQHHAWNALKQYPPVMDDINAIKNVKQVVNILIRY
jgi:hypothetical protein